MPRSAAVSSLPARVSPADPKLALILAAETIFARQGIERASLREIAAHAGQRNHHAVQYHFGSRAALVQAVFDHRMAQMEAQRAALLAEAGDAGAPGALRKVVEAIFLPQIDLIDAQGDHSYAAFLSEYLMLYPGRGFGEFGANLPPQITRCLTLLRVAMADLPEAAAQRRLIGACFLFLNILIAHTRSGDDEPESFSAAVTDTIDQIVAALSVPRQAA
ncbi:MAG: TetR family transcriptional regulator [Sphingomonadales bacterium]|nr:TetR family transcriptional regulator [Sphingomonadales bacterium]